MFNLNSNVIKVGIRGHIKRNYDVRGKLHAIPRKYLQISLSGGWIQKFNLKILIRLSLCNNKSNYCMIIQGYFANDIFFYTKYALLHRLHVIYNHEDKQQYII